MLNVLFFEKYSGLNSVVHRFDPRAKMAVLIGFIVLCVSTPPHALHVLLGYLILGVAVTRLSQVPLAYLMKRFFVILPFISVFFFLLLTNQAVRSEPVVLAGMILRTLLAISALILMSATTPFFESIHALTHLKIPALFGELAQLMYRYLFVAVCEVGRLRMARDSRGFRGVHLMQAGLIGQMIGGLFLKSTDRAERIYQAMLSRGYGGGIRPGCRCRPFLLGDYLVVAAVLAALFLVRFSV